MFKAGVNICCEAATYSCEVASLGVIDSWCLYVSLSVFNNFQHFSTIFNNFQRLFKWHWNGWNSLLLTTKEHTSHPCLSLLTDSKPMYRFTMLHNSMAVIKKISLNDLLSMQTPVKFLHFASINRSLKIKIQSKPYWKEQEHQAHPYHVMVAIPSFSKMNQLIDCLVQLEKLKKCRFILIVTRQLPCWIRLVVWMKP